MALAGPHDFGTTFHRVLFKLPSQLLDSKQVLARATFAFVPLKDETTMPMTSRPSAPFQPLNPGARQMLGYLMSSLFLLTASLAPEHTVAQESVGKVAGASPAPQRERATVSVAPLSSLWLHPQRDAPAQVLARNESRLAAETSGTLLRWTVDVGAQVQRGQLLAQIDPRDAQLGVQRAQAALAASQTRLKLAQAQLQRSRDLVAQGFFSQEALAQRETEVALLLSEISANQAQLATARRQLAKTTLHAPFAGSVKERLAQHGEAVAPGSVLYVLTETGTQEVSATLSPADVAGLRSAPEIRLDTASGSHALRLLRVGATIAAPARTQTARFAFSQAAGAPPAGSSGTLRWRESQPHIAPELMVRRGTNLGIFVQQGSGAATTARFVALPGAQEGRATPVPASTGLAANTLVIMRGQAALQPGQAIEPQVQAPAGAAKGPGAAP